MDAQNFALFTIEVKFLNEDLSVSTFLNPVFLYFNDLGGALAE